jgi:thiosulfate dehydrogenase
MRIAHVWRDGPRWLRTAVLLFAVACGGGSAARGGATAVRDTLLLPAPSDTSLHADPMSASIRRGLALVTATRDSLPRHVGSQLRCVSCHLNEGRRAFAMPWVGVYGRFPQYRSRAGAVMRLEDRINDCLRRSLNGSALPVDGNDMRDIVSYISWLSRGSVSGQRARGNGIDSLAVLSGDTTRGSLVYLQSCARCHAPDGQGMLATKMVNAGAPLWGPGSFNIGSGMARVRVMAAFVHRHMPFDLPGTMAAQDAFDVSAYVTSRPRPDLPGKELDWPKGDPPVDVAYATRGKRRMP